MVFVFVVVVAVVVVAADLGPVLVNLLDFLWPLSRPTYISLPLISAPKIYKKDYV